MFAVVYSEPGCSKAKEVCGYLRSRGAAVEERVAEGYSDPVVQVGAYTVAGTSRELLSKVLDIAEAREHLLGAQRGDELAGPCVA